MSPGQRNFIEGLLRDRVVGADLRARAQDLLDADSTGRNVSLTIDALKACERDRSGEPLMVVETPRRGGDQVPVGIYEQDGTLYAVRPNRARTARYALEIQRTSTGRILESGEEVNLEFEYAPGVVNRLTDSDRVSLARAEELSLRFGRCVCCGQGLKVAESVRRGVGPVCARRYFA